MKGLLTGQDSEDEEKGSSGAFAAVVSCKKSNEEPSKDADKESLHSSSKYINIVCISVSVSVCTCAACVGMGACVHLCMQKL